MQTKRKGNLWKLLLGMTAAIALIFTATGCPTGSDDSGGGDGPTIAPEKPSITGSQVGFELKDSVNLKTVTDDIANNEDNQSAVISFTWDGEGASSYNIYWNDEQTQPLTPKASGIKEQVYFARNLEPETDYYFWIEAVNSSGKTVSDSFQKKTGKAGPQNAGGLERGDYPRGMRVVPGSGSLTVSWNLSDRVGWYEVYYTPVGTIKHLDIYTPKEFRYDSTKTLRPGAIDVSGAANVANINYTQNGAEGHTRPVYPFLTPLAANSGWEGYYVRDGASRVDNDTRPILGTNAIEQGAFYKIGEVYDQGIQDPYKKLDAAFAQAIPWNGTSAGTAGTPVKFFGTSTTITGLTDGTTYEVWVRSPNANGERGYSYITGTPGAGAVLPAVSGVKVNTPEDTTRDLNVAWNTASGATGYRIYASKYNTTPGANANYVEADAAATSQLVSGLDPDTTYYVWVVAVKSGINGTFGSPVSGKTGAAPATGTTGDKVIAGTSHKVKTVVYVEVNDHNPLNAGSYVLEDGTYLFDYVVLFAANIRNRVDAAHTSGKPYVYLNENVQKILENRTKYIVPLQQKGIKVILGLLGDHDGVSFGTMSDTDLAAFAEDVKRVVDLYQLDGVDFDDEWGSKEDWDGWGNGQAVGTAGKTYDTISPNSIWTYPISSWGWPTSVKVYRDPNKEVVAGNGILVAPEQSVMDAMWKVSGDNYYKTIKATRDKLGAGKIVSLYEYNTGRYITAGGAANTTATKDKLKDVIDYALQPWYNQYIADSANGLPRAIYSPFGMDLGGNAYSSQNGAPNPPIAVNKNETATNTINDYATRFKKAATDGNAYNMLYFYALTPASQLLKYQSTDSTATVSKENYISRMTEIVFGKKCMITLEGGDYRKDW